MAQVAPTPQNAPAKLRLGDFLTKEGIITQGQLMRALEEQKSFGGRLGRHLVDLGFVSDAVLQDALARQMGLPRIDLDAPGALAADASRYARADLAEQWGFCPVEFDPRRNLLVIAMSDPDPQLIQDIEGFLAMKVEVKLAPAEAIDRASRRMYHGDGSPVKQMAGLQVARGEQRNLTSASDALGPPPAAPSYEAQLAQQMALQQQQLQQQQLQQQQLQQQQLQQHLQQQHLQQYQLQQYQLQAQVVPPQFPPGVQFPPQVRPPPSPFVPPAPAAPVAAPTPDAYPAASQASIEQLQEHVRRLEKTLATQARAVRTLIELLVEKGVLSKAEMLRKQQSFEK